LFDDDRDVKHNQGSREGTSVFEKAGVYTSKGAVRNETESRRFGVSPEEL
jgi:hypothetical protein